MRYVKPHYYDEFQCAADKCPDTCCAGWQIVIDDDTLEKYDKYVQKQADESFAKRLDASVDWEEGCFLQKGARCAMLNNQNLCDLITAKGEGYLCDTCNRYPRHIEEFDGIREYSLSLSCPVAAEMMLKMREQTRYLVEEDEKPDPLEDEFEDFDFMLFTQLEDARDVIFQIVQDRSKSIEQRMAILMEMARQMQACIDEDRLFDMQDVVTDFTKHTERYAKVLNGMDRFRKIKDGFDIYIKLERLREEWSDVLNGTWCELYRDGYEKYKTIYDEFGRFILEKGWDAGNGDAREQQSWEIFLEQILTFFIYTYFCGAVYDDCIYSKIGMSVMSVCYICEFCMYTWFAQEKKLSLDDCIKVSYRYAREIEHSDLNLNDLEQWLMDRL
ncbi:MAG: flagellin lysine-N-methylase [Lachnospiraceae bacterium]|nr:flagellin lysine-N-methylase [Lachnospiraceae bacterium]